MKKLQKDGLIIIKNYIMIIDNHINQEDQLQFID
jgi:hypothetical protein